MRGISVHHRKDYERRFVQDFSHGRSVCVSRRDGIGSFVFQLEAGAVGVFQAVRPPDFEEYCILSGRITLSPKGMDEVELCPGDVLTLSDMDADVIYHADEASEFFCIASVSSYDDDIAMTSSLEPSLQALQERDGDTLDHCDRVRELVGAIAHETDFPPDQISMLQFAARFHDVGKELVPVDILTKPDRLSDDEFEVMKDHCTWSERIARPVLGDRIATILRQHHERVDGTGYPDGLMGDRIDPAAKIIAVADAYDAMVTSRPYHDGIAPADAIVELRRCAGTQFEPEYVEALARVLAKRGLLSPEG
jgi:HD-GYP domain-containing protein (c-di-GMP phosphodiesterase class II)